MYLKYWTLSHNLSGRNSIAIVNNYFEFEWVRFWFRKSYARNSIAIWSFKIFGILNFKFFWRIIRRIVYFIQKRQRVIPFPTLQRRISCFPTFPFLLVLPDFFLRLSHAMPPSPNFPCLAVPNLSPDLWDKLKIWLVLNL